MKKINLWHIIWIVGIYLVLVAILYLVVIYKVKWQDKDLSTYLYFYKCSENLCSTTNPVNEYYSFIKCENDICPYIKEKNDDILVLKSNDKEYIYNFRNGAIINDKYDNYLLVDDGKYFVAKYNGKMGVIDVDGEIVVPFEYEEILDYKDGMIIYANGNKEGITSVNSDNKVNVEAIYDNIILINDKYYAYKADDGYIINNYSNNTPANNLVYDYIHAYKDIIFVSINNQIDILDSNLSSKISNKITTYYTYKKGEERDTLRIKHDNNLFHFSIYNENNEYTNYIYDIKNKKIYG